MLPRTIPFARVRVILYALLMVALLAGCQSIQNGIGTKTPNFELGQAFREFYATLGGKELLGEAISPVFEIGNVQMQYVRTGLLVYDPNAPAARRLRLAPLGLEMSVAEPPVAPPTQPNARYLDGHILGNDFQPLYEKLLGPVFAGRLLTEVHYNMEAKRYEQYFENVGFYRKEGEPAGVAHLLDYGAWKCSRDCPTDPLSNGAIGLYAQIAPPFSKTINRLGRDFTGFALTPPYLSADGYFEQIFENVVLMVKPTNLEDIRLRAVEEALGVLAEPLVGPSTDPQMTFYGQGQKGHNVPKFFVNYITARGGFTVSGPPIAEPVVINGQVHHQCFTNLCLDYNPNAMEGLRVRPQPLGYAYKVLRYKAAVHPDTATPNTGGQEPEVLLQVWETNPVVAVDEPQVIGVMVLENNLPVAGVRPNLTLILPGKKQVGLIFPPTDIQGRATQNVGPFQVPNGTLIPYQVCLTRADGFKFCYKDSYLVWNNR